MELFYLTRKQMAALLMSLQGISCKTPLAVLQEAWAKSHRPKFKAANRSAPLFPRHSPRFLKKNHQNKSSK